MKKREAPFDCYRVIRTDGQYELVHRRCIKIAHSWWHVEHPDGSITKHNGGEPYHDSLHRAWDGALFYPFAPHILAPDWESWDECRQEVRVVLQAAIDSALELRTMSRCMYLMGDFRT